MSLVQECAVQHYRAFIDVASCLRTLREEVSGIDQHLDSLQDDLPALNTACDGFTKGASEAIAKRAQNKQLHSEALTLPQPLVACDDQHCLT